MIGYRLYFMDGHGRIERAAEFECADDAEALVWVWDHDDSRAMELWSGARVVAKIPKAEP